MLVVLPLAVGGLVALFAGVTATFMRKASLPPRVASPSGELLPSDVIRRIPAPAPLLLGPSPAERVDVVKAAYGALVSDIGYRIENSALFDSAVPATQRFLVALQSWDTGAQTPAQADETERAFAEARAEAERRGISHLPETAREPARRAAKAATTALRSPNQAERRNAASRAAEILNSLALYYLPIIDPAEKSLIGARRMIDPAP